jgi:hypothetical protein
MPEPVRIVSRRVSCSDSEQCTVRSRSIRDFETGQIIHNFAKGQPNYS